MHLNLRKNFEIYDTRELRGGPKLYKSPNFDLDYYVQTNAVKKFYVGLEPRYTWYSDGISSASYFTAHLQWQVSNRLSIVSRTVFSKNIDNDKYAARVTDLEKRLQYLTGTMNRNTISSTLRIDYSLTPEISIQYYGNPYVSIADYDNFRQVKIASAKSLDERYKPLQVNAQSNERLFLGENSTSIYNIKNPNVKRQVFNSNLVARWEFRPGSTLYFVWTNTRFQDSNPNDFKIWKGFGDIWNVKSENAFMIKLSYWFSL
jgi:hypothetical protein